MVAVSRGEFTEWAKQLVEEASDVAVAQQAPDVVDVFSQVVLDEVCGSARSREFAGGTRLLGYNLCLLGYWCRSVELQAVKTTEASVAVSHYLSIAHEHRYWGDDWYATLAGAAYALARLSEVPDELVDPYRVALPHGLGEEFRKAYGVVGLAGLVLTIDDQHPGASRALAPSEMANCWEAGYYCRAVFACLPDEALAEFAGHASENG